MNNNEIKYTIRIILQSLRIGGSKSTALDALSKCLLTNYYEHKSWYDTNMLNEFEITNNTNISEQIMTFYTRMDESNQIEFLNKRKKFISKKTTKITPKLQKNWTKIIKKIFSEFPDPEKIITTFLVLGDIEKCIKICKMTPGIPCSPMLAKPTKSAQDALSKLKGNKFTCELKYDGLRGQAHIYKENGVLTVKIFSRGLENLTEKYPELIKCFKKLANTNNLNGLILDGEVMAQDTASGKILPFQTLMRKQKNSTVSICFYAFDILYKQGVNLMKETFKTRRDNLKTINLEGVSNTIKLATGWDISSKAQIMKHLLTSVEMGGEGLMIKSLGKNSEYIASNRSAQWLKLKKDYIESGGLGDSFDLVVMGAISGEGKRKGLFGSFLVGCYNSQKDLFETCCMVGTGFTDIMLKDLYKRLADKVFIRNYLTCIIFIVFIL